ncbi:patatin-like phospholipase family protein [Cohnella suwonensis]|uniref:Patatin-like phospholipase family protein n=1 Tax=Cohnella suwonensis TaxID=696072 RepID=A0ABW0LRL9_9BACL
MQTTAVNAVFEGGGVKGISLTGAVRAAEQNGIVFHRVAGTSSGSIVAALIAAGYSAVEMRDMIERTPFKSLLKRGALYNAKLVGPALRVLLRKGLYSGDALEAWVESMLADRGIRCFGDLPEGKLRIVASDITNGKLLVLPEDIRHYGAEPGKLSVAKAIRMSTSIPYFFDPVVLKQPWKERKRSAIQSRASYVVDGGLLSNFPLWLFERDANEEAPIPVIGFQMVGRSDAHPHRISGPVTMFQAMFETMLGAHDERYIEKHNVIRTIKIPTLGVGSTSFDLSPKMSLALYESGLRAGEKFFRGWDRKSGTLKVTMTKMTEPGT